MRKQALKIYTYILIPCLIYAIWILMTGQLIECFYLKTTGLECPGCGITRMFLSMFRLDFASAFSFNPFMFVMFFFWNTIGVLCIIDKHKFIKNPKFHYTCFYISFGLMLIFWIYRIVM